MKDWLKSYLSFSRREQRGILVLISMLMTMIILYPLVPHLLPNELADETVILDSLEVMLGHLDQDDGHLISMDAQDDGLPAFSMVPFDPNHLDEQGWMEMGISGKVARTIMNYRNKGGEFRTKDDLKKIYGMKEADYKRLEPWMEIAPASDRHFQAKGDTNIRNQSPETVKTKTVTDTLMIELNSADTASLMKLKGIGRYYAGKILRYRERLGGFIRKEQLMEIEGIDSARFSLLSRQAWADSAFVRRYDLNTSAFKDFLRHPYFEYHIVKAIFQYKDEHGSFSSVEELRKIPLFHEKLYRKIAPYLRVSGF